MSTTSNFFDQFCRICLENKNNLISIFSKVTFDNGRIFESTVQDVLSHFNFEKIQDGPKKQTGICNHCTTLVQATFELKIKLEISTDFLKNQSLTTLENENCNANNIEHDHNYEAYNSSSESNEDASSHRIIDKKPSELQQIPNNKFHENSENFSTNTLFPEIIENKSSKLSPRTKYKKQEKQILHMCPICPKELTALDLRKHIQSHKTLKSYLSVPKLNENVVFYARPREIISLINNKEQFIYKCLYCPEKISVENFWIHMDTHNSKTEHQCDKCDRVFRKISHLSIHQHHHKKDYSYRCNICEKGFILKKNYECHLLTHTNIELPHSCEYCDKKFANPLHLQRHVIVHTENRSYNQKYKVWKCHKCLKTFETNEDLIRHSCLAYLKHQFKNCSPNNIKLKRTMKHKVYSCKLCPKILTSASGLYVHVQTIHHGKIKRILCTVCGVYVRNLSYHMKRHNNVPDFKCHLCSKAFYLKKSLEHHLIVHSGQKPYVCSGCGKTFNNLYNLQVHERIHIGFKSHLCTICGKAFLEKSYLTKHMKVHKNINIEK